MDYRGIEARGESIRIAFQWQGQRCRETLKLPPTKKNMAYAAGLRAEILRKIALFILSTLSLQTPSNTSTGPGSRSGSMSSVGP